MMNSKWNSRFRHISIGLRAVRWAKPTFANLRVLNANQLVLYLGVHLWFFFFFFSLSPLKVGLLIHLKSQAIRRSTLELEIVKMSLNFQFLKESVFSRNFYSVNSVSKIKRKKKRKRMNFSGAIEFRQNSNCSSKCNTRKLHSLTLLLIVI